MSSRRAPETGWTDRTAIVAAAVALPVAVAAMAVVVLDGDPDTVVGPLSVLAPGVVAAVATAIAVRVAFVRRHRDEARIADERISELERRFHDETRQRGVLRELDRALDVVTTETAATDIIRDAFTKHLGPRPMELHLVDAVDPVLELVVATGDHRTKEGMRTSPWDSTAARTGTTLVYRTTDRLDVCPHLQARLRRPMSAIAVPVNVTGRMLGVLYGLGPDGEKPGEDHVTFLEDVGRLIGARLAVLRASNASAATADNLDRLTGLPDRAAMQERVLRLLRDRRPFTVAVADIDGFRSLNDSQGRTVGDQALRQVARVARRAMRPGDIIGRIGGDEFLFVLPHTGPDDATRAFERLREELVLARAGTDAPPLSLSIGVIGSNSGGTIEEILQRAAGALNHAKTQGGNRVIVAQTTRPSGQR